MDQRCARRPHGLDSVEHVLEPVTVCQQALAVESDPFAAAFATVPGKPATANLRYSNTRSRAWNTLSCCFRSA